ncbi:hypothetical protein DL96DRAFT_1478964, partial [Flagelloscypha sp. PMI_526]
DPQFQSDDIRLSVGDVGVPTPYFPCGGALLYVVAIMAGGWDGADRTRVPQDYPYQLSGKEKAL